MTSRNYFALPTKKKPKKRINIGLKATRLQPLRAKVVLSDLWKTKRSTLVAVAVVVVIAGGYLFYRGTHAGAFYPANLTANQTIKIGGTLESANNAYYAMMQSDGNFVIHQQSNQAVVGSTGTQNRGATYMTFQSDGNLVFHKADGSVAWYSHTQNLGGTRLNLRDDGKLVIYRSDNYPLWSDRFGLFSCINPMEGANYTLLPKIDQGVDYSTSSDQPIKAPCHGTVLSTYGGGGSSPWPDNVYINFKVDPGVHSPIAGKCIYFAEYIKNLPALNTEFKAGQVIATTDSAHGSPAGSQEWGWSAGYQTPSSGGGAYWDRFMASLGGPNHGLGTSPIYSGSSC